MKRNCLSKSMFYKMVILFVFVSTILCGCKREAGKEKNKQVDGTDSQSDIDTSNNIDTPVEEESELSDEDTTSSQSGILDKESSQQDSQPTKDYNIDSKWIIQNTVSNLNGLISELTYLEDMSQGQTVDLPISKELSEQDISGTLHDSILDLIEYDLYLEYQDNPNQSHPVVLDYTYSLKYKGFSKDGTQHVFEIRFMMNEQSYADENFDSNIVVSQVTERILNNTEFHMDQLSGDESREARMIEGVQTYESTSEAVESLTRYVENEIEGALFGMAGYTQFRLEFYAKGATSYTFILYLK